MRILVVCGAGASSTFVAQRVRHAALERGLVYAVTAGTSASVPDDLDATHVVLVGPHLGAEVERIRKDAATRGVRVIALPEDVFTDLDGSRTLALVEEALRAHQPADSV